MSQTFRSIPTKLTMIASGFGRLALVAVLFSGCSGGCVTSERRAAARPGPVVDRPPLQESGTTKDFKTELLEEHNRARAEEDQRKLAWNDLLAGAAEIHAKDMADRSRMTHEGSDGSTAERRVIRVGYPYRRFGENIAYGQESVREVMEGWLKSPGHRKNILGNFSQVGAARAKDRTGTIYWCVVFGLPR